MSHTSTDTDWRARAEAAEARVEQLAAERARLWEQLHELRAAGRERDYYRDLYRTHVASVSWRVTTPLRSAKTLVVKVRRRLRSGG